MKWPAFFSGKLMKRPNRRWCIDTFELNSTWRLFRSETGKNYLSISFPESLQKSKSHRPGSHVQEPCRGWPEETVMSWTVALFYGPRELRETLRESMLYNNIHCRFCLNMGFKQMVQICPSMDFHGFLTWHFTIASISILWISLMAVSSALATGFCGISCGRCRCLAHCTESRRHQWLRMRMDGHCWFPCGEAAIISNLGFVWSYKFKL